MMGFVRKRNENHVILAETPNLGFVGEKAKSFIKDTSREAEQRERDSEREREGGREGA